MVPFDTMSDIPKKEFDPLLITDPSAASIDEIKTNCVSQGYRLIDQADGHVWLEFGTYNYDDYYPYFVFRHNPKPQ